MVIFPILSSNLLLFISHVKESKRFQAKRKQASSPVEEPVSNFEAPLQIFFTSSESFPIFNVNFAYII